MDPTFLPAYETKHHAELVYSVAGATLKFNLLQNDMSGDTGTTLWLSSQVLCEYLANKYKKPKPRSSRKRVLELGSGIGLTALFLHSFGFAVTATDLPQICSEHLRANVRQNAGEDHDILIEELDWFDPHAAAVHLLQKQYDVVIASDLIYATRLVPALSNTLDLFVGKATTLYVAQEVRVQSLFDEFIAAMEARDIRGAQIPHMEVKRAMQATRWEDDAWDGVVLWKFKRK